jgi:hypothetical protein
VIFIIAYATRTTTNEDNVNKNTETMRKYTEEPYKSEVYWQDSDVQYTGLEALLAQQEELAIQHMRDYIKLTKSKSPVDWTAYKSDIMATHRDSSGKWSLIGGTSSLG